MSVVAVDGGKEPEDDAVKRKERKGRGEFLRRFPLTPQRDCWRVVWCSLGCSLGSTPDTDTSAVSEDF